MLELLVNGDLNISGDLAAIRADGLVSIIPQNSKVLFKNNDYIISKGDFIFSNKRFITNPDFDIQANTLISNYKIVAKAYGNAEKFNFDLLSDPVLPKNSILSLIAFGYTDNDSNSTTSQQDKRNLTQVGVGSFIFDQFKINELLKKQFGFQLNLGTQYMQTDSSLLNGKSQDSIGGGGLVGRTRSATKIELRKKLSEAMNLSVSSTMGSSVGQMQTMNLNYNLTKLMQVEGVYQLRTNSEGEEDIIDNSIGADLKFRWSFK
jgi:autotransporter translocation and assembly factor TamB